MEPIYPAGTPEYEAYAAELHAELGKFARGEDPYPYRREEVAMPSVPNWITHAIVIQIQPAGFPGYRAVAVKSWRATATQVVVTLDDPGRTELRFRLDGLSGIGDAWRMTLCDATDPGVVRRVSRIRADAAIDALRSTVALTRLHRNREDLDGKAEEICAIRDAATAALAAIAEVL